MQFFLLPSFFKVTSFSFIAGKTSSRSYSSISANKNPLRRVARYPGAGVVVYSPSVQVRALFPYNSLLLYENQYIWTGGSIIRNLNAV